MAIDKNTRALHKSDTVECDASFNHFFAWHRLKPQAIRPIILFRFGNYWLLQSILTFDLNSCSPLNVDFSSFQNAFWFENAKPTPTEDQAHCLWNKDACIAIDKRPSNIFKPKYSLKFIVLLHSFNKNSYFFVEKYDTYQTAHSERLVAVVGVDNFLIEICW